MEARLASGMSRRAAVTRFVESPAVDVQIVNSFYASYLHRQPDAADYQHWTAVLKAPGGSAGKVAVGILSGRSFYEETQGEAP